MICLSSLPSACLPGRRNHLVSCISHSHYHCKGAEYRSGALIELPLAIKTFWMMALHSFTLDQLGFNQAVAVCHVRAPSKPMCGCSSVTMSLQTHDYHMCEHRRSFSLHLLTMFNSMQWLYYNHLILYITASSVPNIIQQALQCRLQRASILLSKVI